MASDRNRADAITLKSPAKVLNAAEGAHVKNMSTFETNEHLQQDPGVLLDNAAMLF